MQVVWEGTTGTRRGRVGVISPAPSLVAVQRGELAGLPARPASRRTRVVNRHFGCAPPVPRGRRTHGTYHRCPHRHPASSRTNRCDRSASHPRRADSAHGRCARAQPRQPRSTARAPPAPPSITDDRPRRAPWHRCSHQRPRPAMLDCGAVASEVLRLRQRRPVRGRPERGVLDTRPDLPGAEHRHRLRRILSRYRGEPPLARAASVRRHSAGTDAG